MSPPAISTCLWFHDRAEDAARFYTALIPGSRTVARFAQRGGDGAFMVVIDLAGQRYSLMNGGPHFTLSPAASIMVQVDTQAELDRLWDALLDGGSPARCGWLTDRWGVSWQILPRVLDSYLQSQDSGVADRVMAAMMAMVKFDIAALDAAAADRT